MSSIKRVSGNYDIYANLTTIHGNLSVAGTTTTVNTEIVNQDEIIAGNLTVNGPLYATGSKGNAGDFLKSNGTTVYWASSAGSVTAAGSNRNIQFNSSGVLGADSQLNFFANGNVQVGNTLIANNATIGTYNSNDLRLYADGTGHVYVDDVLKMQFQTGTTPTNVASTVQLLANTPGGGGTGLYFVNSTGSDEIISKTKATVLALIFS